MNFKTSKGRTNAALGYFTGTPFTFKFRKLPVSLNDPIPTRPCFSDISTARIAPLVFPPA